MKDKLLNCLDKFYIIVEKIGKQNIILIGFIFFIILITGLYQTFSLFTQSEGFSVVDGLNTYQFILTNNEENRITIASNSSKNILITVSNSEDITLKYGVYYSSSDDLSSVNIGYTYSSKYKGIGLIKSKSDYIITARIENNSNSDVTITFGTKYGFEEGGDLTLSPNQYWLEDTYEYLNTVEPGSYVKYVGNNGCDGNSCYGENANYINDDDMGYCNNEANKYTVNGWRVAYVKDDNAYLVSAGAPECLSTDFSGIASSVYASDYELTNEIPMHINNLNSAALKYCNNIYVDNNICANTNVWALNANDFEIITGEVLSTTSCFDETSEECGSYNDLIIIGGNYWFVNRYTEIGSGLIGNNNIFYDYTNVPNGVRPVIKLDSSVIVVGGTGTYHDPYILDNLDTVRDLSGNANHGIISGSDWNQESGIFTTDGNDDFVNAGYANYNFKTNLTLITKVKFNKKSIDVNDKAIIGNGENTGIVLSINNERKINFKLYINNKYVTVTSSNSVELDKWHTIVGTYDGTNLSLYINGVLNKTISIDVIDKENNSITVSPNSLTIGTNLEESEQSNYIAVDYDDILLFNRTLTKEEIQENYQSTINVSNKEKLLLYYDFLR